MNLLHNRERTFRHYGILLALLVLLSPSLYAQPVSFSPQIVISDEAEGAQAVFSIDIDGDGDMDILAASANDNTVEWFENVDGTGVFSSPVIITETLDRASDVYSADLDGDGDMDALAAVSQYDQKIVWFENTDGMGAFGPEMVIATSTWDLGSVLSSDIDGDGDQDVISSQGAEVNMFENMDGEGTFSAAQVLIQNSHNINSICANDLDSDDDNDLLYASGNLFGGMSAWSENLDGAGSFGPEMVIVSSTWNYTAVCSSDLDGDGDRDVLSASNFEADNLIVWHENTDGQGSFGDPQTVATNIGNTEMLFSVDVDGDNDMDLVSASADSVISWFENTDGEGAFGQQHIISDNVDHISGIYCVDLDGDGDNDILCASWGDNTIAWYKNLGYVGVTEDANATNLPQVFELSKVYPNPFNPSTTIEIALPQSAHLDLIVYNTLGEQVAVLSSSTHHAGQHSFTFDGAGNASGIYFIRASVPGHLNSVRKIVLMK